MARVSTGYRWLSAAAVLLPLVALALGACSLDEILLANLPPQTFLHVEDGALAPTHYRQILSWHGEDPDGEVDRFEYRWILELLGGGEADLDPPWLGTVPPFIFETQDTFFLPVPTAGVDTLTHVFQIRAVDREGLADPIPAQVTLPVYNRRPQIWSVTVAGDTTSTLNLPENILPVLTLRFHVADPDNPAADPEEALAFIEEIRFWFEDPEAYLSVAGTDTLLTLVPEDFGDLVGQEREFHLQAVDRGGAGSNVLSASAFVRDVREARVLLMDSASRQTPANIVYVDPFWRDEFSTLLAANELMIHDLANDGPLGDPANLDAIFSLFEAVIWYNGDNGAPPFGYQNAPSPEFTAAEPAVVAYLEAGGHVLLCGYNMVGASRGEISGGSFSADFEFEVLELDSLYAHYDTPGDLPTSNFNVYAQTSDVTLPGFSQAGTEDLILPQYSALRGIDRMALNSDALEAGRIEELYRLNGLASYPPIMEDGAVGIRRNFDSGGELILLTFPISLVRGNDNVLGQVAGFLHHFGVLR